MQHDREVGGPFHIHCDPRNPSLSRLCETVGRRIEEIVYVSKSLKMLVVVVGIFLRGRSFSALTLLLLYRKWLRAGAASQEVIENQSLGDQRRSKSSRIPQGADFVRTESLWMASSANSRSCQSSMLGWIYITFEQPRILLKA